MNFFQHQDDARKKSGLLVFLLILATTCLIVITTLIVSVFLFFTQHASDSHSNLMHFIVNALASELALYISLGVSAVILAGGLIKSYELRGGGAQIAESLGGKLLQANTQDNQERRLLNIVEEMAIASGNPVPRIYLLEEDGINAFAAGNTHSNAVIGVTRGCLNTLNREEIQGVIAHEFSHIHHGDTRLNMRLLAVLHGILVIGLLGEMLMRAVPSHRHGSFDSRRGRTDPRLFALGLALMGVGFVGTFFGKIIKAAVSRQREFLADASAVQYTRNPEGIAAALLHIKKNTSGSYLSAASASEFSHFYFADGISFFFNRAFSTHPPLDTRIHRIYPWGESHLQKTIDESTHEAPATTSSTSTASSNRLKMSPIEAIVASTGCVSSASIQQSRATIKSLPKTLHDACHTAYQARAVIYTLLLDREESVRKIQIDHLRERAHPATYKEFEKLLPYSLKLPIKARIPLIQLAIPSLQSMSVPQQTIFFDNVNTLIAADSRLSPFEWVLSQFLNHALRPTPINNHSIGLNNAHDSMETLFTFVAKLGNPQDQDASVRAALAEVGHTTNNSFQSKLSHKEINQSLETLRRIKPLQKPRILKALAICVKFDGKIVSTELEVMRAIAFVLDCPMPLVAIETQADIDK